MESQTNRLLKEFHRQKRLLGKPLSNRPTRVRGGKVEIPPIPLAYRWLYEGSSVGGLSDGDDA